MGPRKAALCGRIIIIPIIINTIIIFRHCKFHVDVQVVFSSVAPLTHPSLMIMNACKAP